MDIGALITIISLGITILVTLMFLVVALVRGNMKEFIVQKIAEADSHTDWTADQKQHYVIDKFTEHYQIMSFLLNCKKFIELVIKYSKEINYKK